MSIKKLLALLSIVFVIVFASFASVNAKTETKDYLIKFKDTANVSSELISIEKKGGKVEKKLGQLKKNAQVELNETQYDEIKNDPEIEIIEENKVLKLDSTLNSPPSWGQDRVDERQLPLDNKYRSATDGAGVDIYIVDTGVRSTHNEFAGRLQSGFTAIADGRGTEDCHGHGTHVAGTAAGTNVGIAREANIIPVRVMSCDGTGDTIAIMNAVDWMLKMHKQGRPAVANFSLGSDASDFFDSLIQDLINDGITVVTSAGNTNSNACLNSPARLAGVITVGSTQSNDTRSSFSNWGNCLDLFAPGSYILSSYYTADIARAYMSGTSMASPHVAGAAAIILSMDPGLLPSDVEARLISDSTKFVVGNTGSGSPNRLLLVAVTVDQPSSKSGVKGGLTTEAFT